MSDKPERRWLQIHLNTVLVIMFIASVLLYANLCASRSAEVIDPDIEIGEFSDKAKFFGWPLTACYTMTRNGNREIGHFSLFSAGFDCCFALAIIIPTIIALEWIERRRGSPLYFIIGEIALISTGAFLWQQSYRYHRIMMASVLFLPVITGLSLIIFCVTRQFWRK